MFIAKSLYTIKSQSTQRKWRWTARNIAARTLHGVEQEL